VSCDVDINQSAVSMVM